MCWESTLKLRKGSKVTFFLWSWVEHLFHQGARSVKILLPKGVSTCWDELPTAEFDNWSSKPCGSWTSTLAGEKFLHSWFENIWLWSVALSWYWFITAIRISWLWGTRNCYSVCWIFLWLCLKMLLLKPFFFIRNVVKVSDSCNLEVALEDRLVEKGNSFSSKTKYISM